MAIVSRDPITTARPSPAPVAPVSERSSEWWVQPLRWTALAVWLAIPISTYVSHPWPSHIVWSLIIAGLPLFIVLVGYHRWRRICPLAFFSQIPVYLRRPGVRRASPWLEEHYYYIMFAFFAFALWLRLTVINGNGPAIAVFFILLSAAALMFGALFTGKTWCNYICPVSLIEKINTEPHGLRDTPNSQCTKCTACKKSCPDINQENGYWKEIGLRSKRFAYFAYPGLVFSFFLYFYLQASDWNYYFSGNWADQASLLRNAFRPGYNQWTAGFFFLPELPRAVAAGITLAVGTLIGYGVVSYLEPRVKTWFTHRHPEADPIQARHLIFTVVAFVAFVNFYVFAGQPLLRLIPWLGSLGAIFASIAGTLLLSRRYVRTQKAFAEQTVALNIVKRWEWQDMRPPEDLREALLVHTARSTERKVGYAQVLQAYQDAVRETVVNGFVAREEVQRLEALRNQLQIKKADHEKIMAALAEDERALLTDPSRQPSAEKRLQLETYTRALEQHLKQVLAGDAADERLLRQLQQEYNVTDEEHAAQLDVLLGGAHGLAAQIVEALRMDARAAAVIAALAAAPSPSRDFLVELLRRKRAQAVDRIMRVLHVDPETDGGRQIREGLLAEHEAVCETAFGNLLARVAPAVRERIQGIWSERARDAARPLSLTEGLRGYTSGPDPYLRAAALQALAERGELDAALVAHLSEDEHDLVRETAHSLQAQRNGGRRELTWFAKMVALRAVPVFATLEPAGLAELARSSIEKDYPVDEILAKEGEPGEEVYIILAGDIAVLHRAGTADEVLLSRLGIGEILGEMAVLDPAPRSATIRAGAGGVRVLCLDGSAFRDALSVDPAVASGVIRTLARHVRRLIKQV